MPELIVGSFSAPSGKAKPANLNLKSTWQKAEQVDINVTAHISNGEAVNCSVIVEHSLNRSVDNHTSIVNFSEFKLLDVTTNTKKPAVYAYDVITKAVTNNELEQIDSSTTLNYQNILPKHDISTDFGFRSVYVFDEKPKPPGDYKYLPTSDFNLTNELSGFTSDFIDPIDFDKLVTRLSPVGFTSDFPWVKTQTKDIQKSLTYGYSINDFLVGGSTDSNYPVDNDAVDSNSGGSYTPDPTGPIETTRIITIVNTVTVVALPSRTPLLFSTIRLSKHIDSFSWTCSITVLNDASYDLIKPSSIETKDIEVAINGTVWQFFIGKTNKSKQFGSTSYTGTGYSHVAKLQAPYAALNNFSNTSGALASQLVNEILLSTGFTNSWSMPVNWPVSANGFSYQSKSPIDAVAQIASAAGAIIVPDLENKALTIQPWCSDSAWLWDGVTGLPVISEALCFELNEQYTPQDQANAVYVSGNEDGVLLKGKLPGTAGDKLLSTVTDNLITDTSVASERARIELSKAGHKEDVPITTFFDSNSSLYMPGSLVAINMSSDSDWNGLVTNLEVSVENAGVAVYQTLNVSRHYNS